MPLKSFAIVCLLGLCPILGYAQSDAYVLQRILQRYTESYGGFRDADALSSLSVEGTIEQDGQVFDFLIRKKRPFSLRYRLSNASNTIIAGYNGESGWIRTESNGEVSIQDLDDDGIQVLKAQARFESPLFRHLEKNENDVALLARGSIEDANVYVIEVREFGGEVSHYHIDVKTAHVLRCDQLDENGAIEFQTLYRDYKDIEGYPFAHEVENLVDGETVSRVKINTVEVNPGLLSFYFEKPRH